MSATCPTPTLASGPFYHSAPKVLARLENIRLFHELTGLSRIPVDLQYWTLANRGDSSPSSEINQLLSAGLITADQFHGVDFNSELIEANRIDHPEAHWHCGSWLDIISEEDFQPGLISLDTMHESGRLSLNLCASTMKLCPSGVVLLLNVCQSSPHRNPMTTDEFLQELNARVPDFNLWVPDGGVQMYEYCSNATLMKTMAFMLRN